MKGATVALPPGFRSKFLDGLRATELKAVLAAARKETISPRQVLQRQGELGSRLCLLLAGRAVAYKLVEKGYKLFLRWAVPGDTFGLAALLKEPSHYPVTVEGVQEGNLLTWDLASSQVLNAQLPNVSNAAFSVAAGYMDDLINVLAARVFLPAPQRLAQMLVKSAGQLGHVGHEGIELDLTNEQLAVAAHVGLFTATRQLSKWQALGIVKKKRGTILLRSLSSLERIAKNVGEHATAR